MSSSPATRAQAGSAILTAMDIPYVQDFNTLASSGTSSSLPAGWEFVEAGTNANTIYTAGTGSGNAGDTYSFGGAGSTERAFGGLQSGSLIPTIGAVFTNSTGQTITSLDISYTGEQWRLGATGRADRLDFQYSLDATILERRNAGSTSSCWTSSLLSTTGSVGALTRRQRCGEQRNHVASRSRPARRSAFAGRTSTPPVPMTGSRSTTSRSPPTPAGRRWCRSVTSRSLKATAAP